MKYLFEKLESQNSLINNIETNIYDILWENRFYDNVSQLENYIMYKEPRLHICHIEINAKEIKIIGEFNSEKRVFTMQK